MVVLGRNVIFVYSTLIVLFSTLINSSLIYDDVYMSEKEIKNLKKEAMDMFHHAYHAYMNNAFPADELKPLSCKGRWRSTEDPGRGNVDEAMGNFSLTLIDSLDTLVIIGDIVEFEKAIKLVIDYVQFDTNVVVSVFETNIRVLGGLLSAHVLAEQLKEKSKGILWYAGELLDMAKDLGYRLLPAFNTTTGIPYGRVNLKYGVKYENVDYWRDTCTACAGTMILEMAALSRLTGDPIFELKAHKAMDQLWNLRHRTSNLMGTVLDVHSGTWVRREAGVGAGIDSYYEYCLKAYILLNDIRYLKRFNEHYFAIRKYITRGPMLMEVLMHNPTVSSRNFMDALLAFWPGLQVLKGDIEPAILTHEMLYQVTQKHGFLPEAFTADLQVYWEQHPLRPEFIESTYFLYRATGNHHYLHVGRNALKSLQRYARVPCGFASMSDVRTGDKEDSMDSFVLAETFKYLYLLFTDPNDLIINLDEFIFTTEAHFLPLHISKYAVTNHSFDMFGDTFDEYNIDSFHYTCALNKNSVEDIRRTIFNLTGDYQKSDSSKCLPNVESRKLRASEFKASNEKHIRLLQSMGISVLHLPDSQIQFTHLPTTANPKDLGEGLAFMKEMIELSTKSQDVNSIPQCVSYELNGQDVVLPAGGAQFGKILRGYQKVRGVISIADPSLGCSKLRNDLYVKGRIVIVERGKCTFIEKARRIEEAGGLAGIVIDNIAESSAESWSFFSMSGDGRNDVNIPFVFLFTSEAKKLLSAINEEPTLFIDIQQLKPVSKVDMDLSSTASDPVLTYERFGDTLHKFSENPVIEKFFLKPDTKEKGKMEFRLITPDFNKRKEEGNNGPITMGEDEMIQFNEKLGRVIQEMVDSKIEIDKPMFYHIKDVDKLSIAGKLIDNTLPDNERPNDLINSELLVSRSTYTELNNVDVPQSSCKPSTLFAPEAGCVEKECNRNERNQLSDGIDPGRKNQVIKKAIPTSACNKNKFLQKYTDDPVYKIQTEDERDNVIDDPSYKKYSIYKIIQEKQPDNAHSKNEENDKMHLSKEDAKDNNIPIENQQHNSKEINDMNGEVFRDSKGNLRSNKIEHDYIPHFSTQDKNDIIIPNKVENGNEYILINTENDEILAEDENTLAAV